MSALLEVRGLSVRYGGVRAVSELDLDASAAAITGVIGPNGAGKTSVIDAVTGMTRASGRVKFDGVRIERLPAHRRARAGLARTFQSIELFDDLSVRENVLVGAERPTWRGGLRELLRRPRDEHAGRVRGALAMVGLGGLAERRPAQLSHGQRRLVALARALAMRPRLLLLDEPAAGLDSRESDELGERLLRIADDGIGVVLVDHDVNLVLRVCSNVFVMDFGCVLAAGAPDEIRLNEAVVDAYLGAAEPAL